MSVGDDEFKRQPDYAEIQIKSFVTDLAKDYNNQLRAVAKFKEYVLKYKPEVYDDDADLLFRGGKVLPFFPYFEIIHFIIINDILF